MVKRALLASASALAIAAGVAGAYAELRRMEYRLHSENEANYLLADS